MENAVVIFALVHFTVIGLSHVFAPRGWVSFFLWLRSKGEAGVFIVGGMSLWFGSIIVAFHNVWTGWATLLTLLGWAQVFKGALYLVFPKLGLRMLGRVSEEKSREFVYAGAGLLAVLAALLAGRYLA